MPNGGSGCSSNADCASGACSGGTCLAWPGATCTGDAQCASGKCRGGRCFANSLGGACRTTADCTNNITCGPTQVCGGLGAACTNNNKCVSGNCQGGLLHRLAQASLCHGV